MRACQVRDFGSAPQMTPRVLSCPSGYYKTIWTLFRVGGHHSGSVVKVGVMTMLAPAAALSAWEEAHNQTHVAIDPGRSTDYSEVNRQQFQDLTAPIPN